MRKLITTLGLLFLAHAAMGQSNVMQLCDQQAVTHCWLITGAPTIAANFASIFPAANAAGPLNNDGAGNLSWGPGLDLPLAGGTMTGEIVSTASPIAFAATSGYIQSDGGFVSAIAGGSGAGFNSNTDGALLRGYSLSGSTNGTTGGAVDIAPIAYSPTPGQTCMDEFGNPVSQPLALSGSFGANDVLVWNSTSPIQGYYAPYTVGSTGSTYWKTGTSCAAPLTPAGNSYGLNVNAYVFANQGFATKMQTANAFEAFAGGGMTAQAFTAAGIYPAGTQLRAGFTVNPFDTADFLSPTVIDSLGRVANQFGAALGGYVYTGFSDQDPGNGNTNPPCSSIATCDNPMLTYETLAPGEISFNTTLGCERVFTGTIAAGGSGWQCMGGGFTNPMTTLGDTIYGGAAGAATRLAGDTSNNSMVLTEQASGGVAQAEQWIKYPISAGTPTSSAGTIAGTNSSWSVLVTTVITTFTVTLGSSFAPHGCVVTPSGTATLAASVSGSTVTVTGTVSLSGYTITGICL